MTNWNIIDHRIVLKYDTVLDRSLKGRVYYL